jgi:hypothetical protein
MTAMHAPPTVGGRFKLEDSTLERTARLLWDAVRLLVLGILLLVEPVVRLVCSVALVFGAFACAMVEISAVGPRFPFFWMLLLSLAFAVALLLYYGLIAWLSR